MSYKISVIIPVYNAEKYLEESINSIISSSVFNELEVLLIDDGSKDNSSKICDSFSEKYENIKTFHIENGGVSNARNIALANANGEYITFCDADDYYLNDIMKSVLEKLKEKETDLLFFEFLCEDRNNNCPRVTYPFESGKVLAHNCNQQFFKYMLSESHFNSLWHKVFKRDLIETNNIRFNKEQRRGGDRDFVIRFLAVCKSAFYLPEVGYFYRYVQSSIVNKPRTDHFDNIYVAYKFKVEMAPKFNITSDELQSVLDPEIVNQVVFIVFLAAGYNFSHFSVSMKNLFDNEKLMEIIERNNNVKLKNRFYELVRKLVVKKSFIRCWILVKTMVELHKIIRKFK